MDPDLAQPKCPQFIVLELYTWNPVNWRRGAVGGPQKTLDLSWGVSTSKRAKVRREGADSVREGRGPAKVGVCRGKRSLVRNLGAWALTINRKYNTRVNVQQLLTDHCRLATAVQHLLLCSIFLWLVPTIFVLVLVPYFNTLCFFNWIHCLSRESGFGPPSIGAAWSSAAKHLLRSEPFD